MWLASRGLATPAIDPGMLTQILDSLLYTELFCWTIKWSANSQQTLNSIGPAFDVDDE
jgi:hypothetical protein